MYRFAWVKDMRGLTFPCKFEVTQKLTKIPFEKELIVYSITEEEYKLSLKELSEKYPYVEYKKE